MLPYEHSPPTLLLRTFEMNKASVKPGFLFWAMPVRGQPWAWEVAVTGGLQSTVPSCYQASDHLGWGCRQPPWAGVKAEMGTGITRELGGEHSG